MRKYLLASTASLAAFALATPAAADVADELAADVATDVATVQAADDEGSALPEMTFGTWGVDPNSIDPSIDPGDDFFAYVNGRWVAENEIPPEFSRVGAFTLLGEKSRSDVRTLMNELVAGDHAPGSVEQRLVDAFNAYMDVDAINAAGLAPAQAHLDAINAADTIDELAVLFATPGYSSMISGGVTVDRKDPESYAVSVGFNGMGLPDRDYYLVDNERNEAIRAAYIEYLTFLFDRLGHADAAAVAQSVYAFEHQVAELEWDRNALRNADLTYNKVSGAELRALTGDFPIDAMLSTLGLEDVDTFLVSQIPPDAEEAAALGLGEEQLAGIGGGLPAMAELLTDTPVATIQHYMAARFLSGYSSVLPSDIDDATFNFYGRTLSGAEEQQPRWKRALANTQGLLGEQLGQVYVERYFPQESKDAMDELVANLRLAMRESLNENDWMTQETREQALAKLDSFTPKIGYPDDFETYEGLEITPHDPLANAISGAAWGQRDSLSRLGGPVDRSEWFMLPQTVNAYYNPVFNEIVFPAAILQQPFFAASNDPAVNYGAIGGVIGHEIGHGFDDQGSKYDSTGTLRNWWQEEDLARFTEMGDALVAQYNAYCPYDDGETCVDGRFTLGENIGDVGGLSLAYRAYRLSLNGEEAPVIDGLTGDQRFFMAWAQVWRAMQREANGRQRLQTDPHSPEEFRVNGVVRNLDAWYEAFGVTPDDDLYLAPEDRVTIW